MSCRSFRNLVLIACVSLPGAGCSMVLVHGPPSGHEDLGSFTCSEGVILPALDGGVAAASAVILATSASGSSSSESDAVSKGIGTLVGLGGLVLWGGSSIVGLNRVSNCKAAQSELAKRSRAAAAEAVQLRWEGSTLSHSTSTGGPSIGGPGGSSGSPIR
jgi:hypothetical protein